MALEDEIRKAIDNNDYDSISSLMNRLRLEVLSAMQSDDRNELLRLEQEIDDALIPYRSITRLRQLDTSFFAGQMYALVSIVDFIRESHPLPDDIREAQRSKLRFNFLLALAERRSVLANDLKQIVRTVDGSALSDSQLSQIGSQLVRAGLVRRDRIGRHANYRLTASGTLVMRELKPKTGRAQICSTEKELKETKNAEMHQPHIRIADSTLESILRDSYFAISSSRQKQSEHIKPDSDPVRGHATRQQEAVQLADLPIEENHSAKAIPFGRTIGYAR